MENNIKTKEEIFKLTIMENIRRKSKYIDKVQMHGELPLFSWIDINPTELCNRKCEFCPRKDAEAYPSQNLNMDINLAKKIADELKSYNFTGGVIFSGHGEPLLHNDITGLVGVFGEKIHTELVTNGDRLNDALLRELFLAGLGVIIVSLYDGPFQVNYFKEMFVKAGLSEEQYVLRDRWYSIEEDYGLKLTNRAGTVKDGNQDNSLGSRPCFYLDYSMQVDWNGDVLLCVQDFNKRIKFGNVYAESLLDIWKCDNFVKYRKVLGRGFRVLSPCSRCNVNGTLHGSNHAKIWNEIYNEKN